jgi:hypothetical protein
MFAARDSLVGITPQRHPGPRAFALQRTRRLREGLRSYQPCWRAISKSSQLAQRRRPATRSARPAWAGRNTIASRPAELPSRSLILGNSGHPLQSDTAIAGWRCECCGRPSGTSFAPVDATGVSSVLREWIAIALTGLCLVGMSACKRPASEQDLRGASPGDSETAKSVHPSVPGRNIPCPREGGLDKAGYPCEPSASSAGSKDKP